MPCPAMAHDKEGSRLRTLTHRGKPKGQEENTKLVFSFLFYILKRGKQTFVKPEREITVIMPHQLNIVMFTLGSFISQKATAYLKRSSYLSFVLDSSRKKSNGILFTNALFDRLLAKLFQPVFSIQCCQI